MSNEKQCVNGNCSRRKECGTYHQAVNTLEAGGANGKFARHTCKKGQCDHFTKKPYVEYGEEWTADTMKLPKSDLVCLVKMTCKSRDAIVEKYKAILELVKKLEGKTI
jgi:hypothetical protein